MAEAGGPSSSLRFKADVWQYFEICSEKKVKCLICDPPKELAYNGGTTNLQEHLISRHNSEYKPDLKQKSILDYSRSKSCSS